VHLKGGVTDALLYRATMVLTVGGKTLGMFEYYRKVIVMLTNNCIALVVTVFTAVSLYNVTSYCIP
jgi:hypothetical protein